MAFLSAVKIKSSLVLAGLAAFLAACGGGSTDNANGGTASFSPATMRADASKVLPPDTVPPQTAPPNANSPRLLATTTTRDSASSASDGPFGQDSSGYTLTFHDSFDGGDLDREVWNTNRYESPNSTTNYATKNGTLKIWPERGKNGEFFDRTLDTDGRFSQRYGYFEIEAKLPKGKGVWPAFWLFNQVDGRRPEIDILEAYPGGTAPGGGPGDDGVPVAKMYAPVVWTTGGERAGYDKVATPDLSAGFHHYGVKWEPNHVTFYFDGREVYSLDASLSDPLFIILDLWFGSASGDPDGSTPAGESNALEVNYVKAWQFK